MSGPDRVEGLHARAERGIGVLSVEGLAVDVADALRPALHVNLGHVVGAVDRHVDSIIAAKLQLGSILSIFALRRRRR